MNPLFFNRRMRSYCFSRFLFIFSLMFGTGSGLLRAASFEHDFAVVFIDASTEAKYGAFPINRALIANEYVTEERRRPNPKVPQGSFR